MPNLQLPEGLYRWLVWMEVIPNNGELHPKGMVSLPIANQALLQNGFYISQTIKNIKNRMNHPCPSSLMSVKQQIDKTHKMTNWNLIWLAYEQLEIQIEPSIKKAILQADISSIIQVLEQLSLLDESKSQIEMKQIEITEKGAEPKVKFTHRSSHLDAKKINFQKNPQLSQSSLQFIIILLGNSLGMPLDQILGLFTEQNKYLAHIIVKGINQDHTAIRLFYRLLIKHNEKLKKLFAVDQEDAYACMYSLKPGLISKDAEVGELAIDLFSKLGKIYSWFISPESNCSNTLLLGIRRHPNFIEKYWQLLLNIISQKQIEYFTVHYKKSYTSIEQMVDITLMLLKPISQSKLVKCIIDEGIISDWLQIALKLNKSSLQRQLLAFSTIQKFIIDFLGQCMKWFPDCLEAGQDSIKIFSTGWKERTILDFTLLFMSIAMTLEELASDKNHLAKIVYTCILNIFAEVFHQNDKKEFIVLNFIPMITRFPSIPTQYIVQNYSKQQTLTSHDEALISIAIIITEDTQTLITIGQTLLKQFIHQPVLNYNNANLLQKINLKLIQSSQTISSSSYMKKNFKEVLNAYTILNLKERNQGVPKQKPMYFGVKDVSDRNHQQKTETEIITQKCMQNLLQYVQKTIILNNKETSLMEYYQQQLMYYNMEIRKHKDKNGNKNISLLLYQKFGITKQNQLEQQMHHVKVRKNNVSARKNQNKGSYSLATMNSKVTNAPQHVKKTFQDLMEKRKKEEDQRRQEELRKDLQRSQLKMVMKKELELVNYVRGFSGQAELKEQGFWAKLLKNDYKQIQVLLADEIQTRQIEYIENIFHKYHKVLRSLFLNYSYSMYSSKNHDSFNNNSNRKQTISAVEIIKLLKDYQLFYLTNANDCNGLLRDVNVKLMSKREVNQLDFYGFEQFIIQFCFSILTRQHIENPKTNKKSLKMDLSHYSLWQLVQHFFSLLKLAFIERGENINLFNEPQSSYFMESEVIKQFNKQIQKNPNFILPEGYKKVNQIKIEFTFTISDGYGPIPQSYIDVVQLLDSIISSSAIQAHFLEPMLDKKTIFQVKPQTLGNIKSKLTESYRDSKNRASSTIVKRKIPAHPPLKMQQQLE